MAQKGKPETAEDWRRIGNSQFDRAVAQDQEADFSQRFPSRKDKVEMLRRSASALRIRARQSEAKAQKLEEKS